MYREIVTFYEKCYHTNIHAGCATDGADDKPHCHLDSVMLCLLHILFLYVYHQECLIKQDYIK